MFRVPRIYLGIALGKEERLFVNAKRKRWHFSSACRITILKRCCAIVLCLLYVPRLDSEQTYKISHSSLTLDLRLLTAGFEKSAASFVALAVPKKTRFSFALYYIDEEQCERTAGRKLTALSSALIGNWISYNWNMAGCGVEILAP